jgi:squalene-hopene/tetraprenyl-beta-curcumene cyclase
MNAHSRRAFLAGSIQGLSMMAVASWPGQVSAASAPPDAGSMAAKGVAFLKARQGSDGSWSGDREPGITALVVTAMLRSGRITPEDPAITKGLGFLEK